MQRGMTTLLSGSVLLLLVISTATEAQNREEGPWWPHPVWGADDQAGGSNWITPEKILHALSLVETGKVYELGQVYERAMPLVGARTYSMFIPATPTYGPLDRGLIANDDFLCTEIGQVGTQFDGPGHVGKRMTMADGSTEDVYYNGVPWPEMKSSYELQKLGVENVKPIVTRGVLIDVAGYKGVESLENGYEVTLSDVRGALARQGIEESSISPGDALFFNFGWWRYWTEPGGGSGARPGVGHEVAAWIVERQASMVGSGTGTDVDLAVHEEVTLKNGIFNLEFMTFESLLADELYEFLFIFTPLRLRGATGSPGRPVAIG